MLELKANGRCSLSCSKIPIRKLPSNEKASNIPSRATYFLVVSIFLNYFPNNCVAAVGSHQDPSAKVLQGSPFLGVEQEATPDMDICPV